MCWQGLFSCQPSFRILPTTLTRAPHVALMSDTSEVHFYSNVPSLPGIGTRAATRCAEPTDLRQLKTTLLNERLPALKPIIDCKLINVGQRHANCDEFMDREPSGPILQLFGRGRTPPWRRAKHGSFAPQGMLRPYGCRIAQRRRWVIVRVSETGPGRNVRVQRVRKQCRHARTSAELACSLSAVSVSLALH